MEAFLISCKLVQARLTPSGKTRDVATGRITRNTARDLRVTGLDSDTIHLNQADLPEASGFSLSWKLLDILEFPFDEEGGVYAIDESTGVAYYAHVISGTRQIELDSPVVHFAIQIWCTQNTWFHLSFSCTASIDVVPHPF